MAEEISFENYDYRSQGGEIHRRPMEREGLNPWEAAWQVVPKDQRPVMVLNHFEQARNKDAVN